MDVLDRLKAIGKQEPSLDDLAGEVRMAWRSIAGNDSETWVREVYTDYAIVCVADRHYRIPYTRGDSGVEFDVENAAEVEMEWAEVTKTIVIDEVDTDRHLAFGWAYALEKDGQAVTDHSGEFVDDPAVLEDAAYLFNLHFREGDEYHTEAVKAQLVESFVSTPEKLEQLGLAKDALPTGWWVGFHVDDDEMWKRVKSGELAMFSIGGWAQREKVDA